MVQATWGGYKNEEWETYTSEPLTAGEHTLKWKYTKDSSVNPTGDYFAVDNVVLGEALPPPVTAEPVNIITRVDVLDLVLPAWGAAPVYSASVPDDVHYSIDRIEWYAVNGSYLLNNYPYMVFDDPNELYRAFIFLTADEGYEFAEEVTATINGEQSLVDHEDDYYGQCVVNSIGFTVTAPSETNPPVTAPPELEIIDTIELIGFVEPVWGAAPSYNVTVPEGANYTITQQNWCYYAGVMVPLQDGDLFNVEGREYSMLFRVAAEDGYAFAEDLNITINGRDDLVSFHTNDSYSIRIDTIDFTVSEPADEPILIEIIELNGFVEPVWGAAPSCNVTVPEGANYTVTEQGWYYYTGDMTPLEDGELFNDEGREYSMIFRLVPAEGYVFANSGAMTVTINGRDIVASCYVFGGGTSCRIDTIDFTVTEPGNEPILIDTVEINDFMVPTWGAHPDFDVSVPEGAMYSVSSILWVSKNDDDYDTLLTADDVFDDESLRYYAVIYFEAAEGYAFSPDAVGTVNGGTEYIRDFNAPDSSGSFFMGFFTVTEPTTDPTVIDTIEINDFVAPVWGEHPFFGVTVPEGANYRISSVEWKYSANGMDWEPMDSGAAFDNETFVYFMEAKFLPNDGYRFSDELTFMINGGTELVMFSGLIAGEAWLETQIFTVEEPAPLLIDTIEINGFVVPTWGAAPFYDVTVPDDAPYSISYNVWSKWDYNGVGALGQMQPGETFNNPNWAYYQYFNIIPDEGYDFADEVTILINGETTYVSHGAYNFAWGYGYYYIFTIDFYVEEPAPIPGDVNRDGEVTLDDALLAMRYVLGLAELTDEQLALADVNGDGEVSMLDALMILRKTMGIIDSFPVENLPVTSLRIK